MWRAKVKLGEVRRQDELIQAVTAYDRLQMGFCGARPLRLARQRDGDRLDRAHEREVEIGRAHV